MAMPVLGVQVLRTWLRLRPASRAQGVPTVIISGSLEDRANCLPLARLGRVCVSPQVVVVVLVLDGAAQD